MPSAITVATPTPATLISQTITKKRFKRTFTIPEKVYTSNINGSTEYFTESSPLPEIDSFVQPTNPNEEVLEF